MLKKILLGILILLIVVAGGFYLYVQTSWNTTYDIAYPDLEVSTDSAVIARGRYIVHGPAHCVSCHVSSWDDMIASDKGDDVPLRGGVEFKMNPIGTMYPKNLTPDPETGIGRYSDGQLFRMMRHAVKPDGTGTLSVMMPFWNMADDDLVAIVSYLRSMEPVRNEVPNAEWTFIGKMVHVLTPTFQPIIDPKAPATAPPMSPPSAARGEYLARSVANCVGCHTERDLMTYEAIGPEFAGGMEFEPFPDLYEAVGVDPDLWTRSPNLTPGPGSRFSQFSSVDEWKQRFRAGRTLKHSPMDWGPFSRMSDEDLESLWLFLKTVPPVEKDVGPIVYKKEE